MLYYHKCLDCLTPFASTEKKIDECDCCGPVICMGIVHGDLVVKQENRPACDGRCTHAHGPSCDCACGGVNHGTGRTVSTTVVQGKVKVVNPDQDIMDDMLRGYKYRELRDYANALYTKLFGHLDYWNRDARQAKRELDKIKAMKVYDRRQQELVNFIAKYYKEESK